MLRFDCAKLIKQLALISDEVAGGHFCLHRGRRETEYVHMRERKRVWAHEKKRERDQTKFQGKRL